MVLALKRRTLLLNDGTEQVFTAGDFYLIEPGHDGWTVGPEPCVAHEFNSTLHKILGNNNTPPRLLNL